MPAEVTSLAQVSGVELLRVPQPTAADFQTSLPDNIVRFPSELDPTQYRQFEFPNGEILPLSGIKAEYLLALLNSSPDNPLLDELARQTLKKPGEEITKAKLHKRLLNARWGLKEALGVYGVGYEIEECLHETAPNEFKRATFLRQQESASESTGPHEAPDSPIRDIPTADQETHAPSAELVDQISPLLPLHEQLRPLAQAGVYTYSEIVGILFPGIPLAIGRNRLQAPLTRLRGKLFNEGLYIPDGRGKKGGIVTVRRFDNGPVIPENTQQTTTDGTDETKQSQQQPVTDTADELIGEEASSHQPVINTAPEEPDEHTVDEEAAEEPIRDPIERRVEAKKSGKPKLIFFPHPKFQGRVNAQIEIPGQGKTPQLELTSDEASLFETIFTSHTPYTHEGLEIKMVDVARSDAFEHMGGFENVFNSLNRKLLAWRVGIDFNNNRELVLVNAKAKPLILSPTNRNNEEENLQRNQGKQRKRQPSHGKLRL